MKAVALSTPTGWAVTGLTDVMAWDQGVASALGPAFALLACAALTLGVGIKLLKFDGR